MAGPPLSFLGQKPRQQQTDAPNLTFGRISRLRSIEDRVSELEKIPPHGLTTADSSKIADGRIQQTVFPRITETNEKVNKSSAVINNVILPSIKGRDVNAIRSESSAAQTSYGNLTNSITSKASKAAGPITGDGYFQKKTNVENRVLSITSSLNSARSDKKEWANSPVLKVGKGANAIGHTIDALSEVSSIVLQILDLLGRQRNSLESVTDISIDLTGINTITSRLMNTYKGKL